MFKLNLNLRKRNRASVLILTLIVVALLTLGAMAFFQKMFLEYHAARTHGRKLQARHFAESGLDFTKFMLSQPRQSILELGGIYTNPMLKGVLVYDDPAAAFRGRFTLVAPDMTTDGYYLNIRYGGLENESSKLNLNTLVLAEAAGGAASAATGGATGASTTGGSTTGTTATGSTTGGSTTGATGATGGTTGAASGSSAASSNNGKTLLMTLPGMTEAIADAILDWIDTDETPRPLGAEAAEYQSAGYPYKPRNGPLQSLDELLLVRDVTPALLYGADLNRDGLVQPMEQRLRNIDNVDNSQGLLDRGWSAYLTIDSAERNVRPDGSPKIDINMENLVELNDQLSTTGLTPDFVKFIIAYRQGGQTTGATGAGGGTTTGGATAGGATGGSTTGGSTSGGSTTGGTTRTGTTSGTTTGGATGGGTTTGRTTTGATTGGGTTAPTQTVQANALNLDFQTQAGRVKLTSILDLIGARANVVQTGQTQAVAVESPFVNDPSAMQQYLPILMDNLAVNTAPSIPGRLNINQAPRQLLMGVPVLKDDPTLIETILSYRDVQLGGKDQTQSNETWLLMQGIVDLPKMKQLLPYITTRGDVYRARVVGFYDADGPLARIDAIIDATKRPPVVLRQWEVQDLGQDAEAYSPILLGGQPDNTP